MSLPPPDEGKPHDSEPIMSLLVTLGPDFWDTPLTNLDLILFVGGSYCKNEKGISEQAMLLPPNMSY